MQEIVKFESDKDYIFQSESQECQNTVFPRHNMQQCDINKDGSCLQQKLISTLSLLKIQKKTLKNW